MDTYKTLLHPSPEAIYKEKGSKFLSRAYPVEGQEQIKNIVESVKKEHHLARHWCYAWQLGYENPQYRTNDDGEPAGTAGLPIYGQIQSFGVTNVLVVVVRYFGGIKLGVGGLVQAYKTSSQMALQQSCIEQRFITENFLVHFEYKDMGRVMRIIKEKKIEIHSQQMTLNCTLKISVRKKDAYEVFSLFDQLFGVTIEKV